MAIVQLISGQIIEGAKLINVSSPDEEGSRSATAIIDGKEYPVYNSVIDGFDPVWYEQIDYETWKMLKDSAAKGFVEGSIASQEKKENNQ